MNYIFDVDGTLWDTTEVVAEAWNDSICEIGLEEEFGRFITAKTLQTEFGKPMDEIMDDLFPGKSREFKNDILAVIKVRERNAVVEYQGELAYPGVRDTIRELSATNNLYIVSNCQSGYIEMVMEKLGITEYIRDFESFGATGLVKVDNIKLVVERNHLLAADTYYVGDTAGDYYSTVGAGISFIHAAYGFGTVPEEFSGRTIQSIDELLK